MCRTSTICVCRSTPNKLHSLQNPSAIAAHLYLKTHGFANFNSHVTQTTQANHTNLHASLVQPIVHERAVCGDASTQQWSCCIHRQVLWQVQDKPAAWQRS